MCSDSITDWANTPLPPAHILKHLTDAHCHAADLNPSDAEFDTVGLGGLAVMSTSDDQDVVGSLGAARPWTTTGEGPSRGPRVVSAFGYHPWFVHRYSLQDPVPPKEEHYRQVLREFDDEERFQATLPLLPDPEPFAALLAKLRTDVTGAKDAGRLVLIGEIGLDATARVRIRPTHSGLPEDWVASDLNVTPFKTLMSHQEAIARAQVDLAVGLGVSISFHCVGAAGSTLKLLDDAKRFHGPGTFAQINVCIHSCGGMSDMFLMQTAKSIPNAYFSPSMAITTRSRKPENVVRAIPRDRILVESDAPVVDELTGCVWAATLWIAQCRGWKVESEETCEWEMHDEDEVFDKRGRLVVPPESEVWAVQTLERNWARYMGMLE